MSGLGENADVVIKQLAATKNAVNNARADFMVIAPISFTVKTLSVKGRIKFYGLKAE